MVIHGPSTDTILRRFSCRTYVDEPLPEAERRTIEEAAASLSTGPLGTRVRFRLVTAAENDRDSLKGLGTYGFIRGARSFIVGAVSPGAKDMEDYGCALESLVLLATDLGLGTCWLGGTFHRSSFARKIEAAPEEKVPAVTPVGRMADPSRARDTFIRRQIRADSRFPWERLFFDGRFGTPLAREEAGDFATALEMVRRGPSASNRQPWRVIRHGGAWHFFLVRSPGYRTALAARLLALPDLQRVDMGIAMCHFALACRERGLPGGWEISDPALGTPDWRAEYTASWITLGAGGIA